MVDPSAALAPGTMVGEYRIEGPLGAGSFGAVYRAVHPVIGKAAAVKVLGAEFSKHPDWVERFIDEARAVNTIRHRHIIDIFSFGQLDDGRHYFVMELLDGMTFREYLDREKRLSPATLMPILRKVARALDAAHAAGIAHRDLKPDNLFLSFDEDGAVYPKLLDFGIAKLMGDGPGKGKTQAGVAMGTPLYMSPEQCRGVNVDHRTDIYALGALSYEALTGVLPFNAGSVAEIMMRHLKDPAPPLTTSAPDLPAALDAPIQAMLEKDPADRPPSAGAAIAALDAVAQTVDASYAPTPSSAQAAPAHDPSMATGAWLEAHSTGGHAVAPTAPGAPAPGVAPTAMGTAAPAHTAVPAHTAAPMTRVTPASLVPIPAQTAAGTHGAASHGAIPHAVATAPSATPSSSGPPWAILGAVGGVLVLLVVGAALMFTATDASDTGPSEEEPEVTASAEPAPERSAPVVDDSVTFVRKVPSVGTKSEQRSNLHVDFKGNVQGRAISVDSTTVEERLVEVTDADDWTVRAIKVQYFTHEERTAENGDPEKREPTPLASKNFVVRKGEGGKLEVTASGGGTPTAAERDAVIEDVEDLFEKNELDELIPSRPLKPGDVLKPPLELVGRLVESDGSIKVTDTTFTFRGLDGDVATFDVTMGITSTEDGATMTATLKGTLKVDPKTTWSRGLALSGPVEVQVAGQRVTGSMKVGISQTYK